MDRYKITNALPRSHFVALVVSLIAAAHDHFDDCDTDERARDYRHAGLETLGHQIACLCAQRTDEGVGTGDCIEALGLFDTCDDDEWWLRVSAFLGRLEAR